MVAGAAVVLEPLAAVALVVEVPAGGVEAGAAHADAFLLRLEAYHA